MTDVTPPRRVLLGTAGWARADWLQTYYPDDLPPDWQLAYYANDADCLLLSGDEWRTLDPALLDEAPDSLTFFLQVAPGALADHGAALARFDAGRSVLLVDAPLAGAGGYRQWVAQGPGCWRDPQGEGALQCWTLDEFDLRDLRQRVLWLDSDVRALLLDGAAASPLRLGELRTLLELLQRA